MKKLFYALLFFVFGSLTTLISGLVFAQSLINFPDVKSTDWYYQDVMNMVEWDVIQGNDDGTFKPANYVNRAELSAMWNRYNDYLKTQFVMKEQSAPLVTDSGSVGDSETIDLNTKGTLNGVSLTIKSIEDFLNYNQYSAPTAGNKYVAVDVLVENNSGETIAINPLQFVLKDSDNYEYQVNYMSTDLQELNMGDVENGRSVRGFLFYEVPETVDLVELKYEVDYGALGQFYVDL